MGCEKVWYLFWVATPESAYEALCKWGFDHSMNIEIWNDSGDDVV